MSVRSEVIRIMNEVLADSKKITQLPAGSAPSGAELVEAVQGGVNVKLTVSQLGGGGGGSQDLQSVLDQGSTVDLTADVVIEDTAGTHSIIIGFSLPLLDYLISVSRDAKIIAQGEAWLHSGSGGSGLTLDEAGDSLIFEDNRGTPRGLGEAFDYSANKTDLDCATKKMLYVNTFNRQTASYPLVLADAGKIVEMNVGSANNLTVPLNSSVAFHIGTEILINQYGAGQTTIVATGGVTLISKAGALKISAQYSGCVLIKVGTDEWYVQGDLTT